MDEWIEKILQGDMRALAQAISAIENQETRGEQLLKRVFPHTGRATMVGITGAPGSGKSTLVDALAAELRKRGYTVGILAVDPTSSFTGGAILGDRVRMQAHASDPEVFIRSMATRGALGGLAAASMDAAMLLDAAGKQFVLIETVGVGQDEVEVARIADATLLLLVPGMGDDVQAFKAGVMEIADLFVVNKSDYSGADRLEEEIRAVLSPPPSPSAWQPPILRTVATEAQGVHELLNSLMQFFELAHDTGSFYARRKGYWRQRILEIVRARLVERVLPNVLENTLLSQQADEVAARRLDPYSAAEKIFDHAGWNAAVS